MQNCLYNKVDCVSKAPNVISFTTEVFQGIYNSIDYCLVIGCIVDSNVTKLFNPLGKLSSSHLWLYAYLVLNSKFCQYS